ncbi:hypothetical protein Scep_029964 [Stephania cephalantha]|uniref:Uncharacterized protein n=1 Tax=Stephania cephalantha TaxID=152367 RepID=A0AAP0E1Z9_9MAGN
MTKQYDLPPRLCVWVGPNKSIWISSKARVTSLVTFVLNDDFTCLPRIQGSHSLSFLNVHLGRPLTRSCLVNFDKFSMLVCPNLRCHNHASHSLCALKHETFCIFISSKLMA